MTGESFKDKQMIIARQQVKEKDFWLKTLSGTLVKSFFPHDLHHREHPDKQDNTAALPFAWTGQLFHGLMTQSGNSHYKFHIIILAGVILLLDKYTGNHDIVVCTPIYRPEIEVNFINALLPIRLRPGAQNTFKEVLKLVSKTVVEASAHQNYPMEILLEQIGMPLIKGEPSLFDTAVVIENIHDPRHIRSVKPGVIFSFLVTDSSIKGKVEYNSNLYERTTIERLIVHLERLVAKVATTLDHPLSDLDIVSEKERRRLLNEFNHTDGTIEFSGRKDNRIIIRGCWVQPEKIEKYLLKIAHVNEAVITTTKNENHQDAMSAYFVSKNDLSPAELRKQLSGKLPGYLIPESFVRLEKMPLTPEGKIDRNREALLKNEARAKTRYTTPGDIVEEKLTGIWSEVLEIEKDTLTIDTDFSRLTGQSLHAIMMSTKIHKEFDVSVPIPVIFELATIGRLAEYIKGAINKEFIPLAMAEEKEYYVLSSSQRRLYLFQQLNLKSTSYNVPQVVRLQGHLDREKLEKAYKQLIQRHETLRTSFEMIEEVPAQKVHRETELTIEYHYLKGCDNQDKERKIIYSFIKPFDLARAPLLRMGLIKRDESNYILMLDRHHIISDAASRAIFLKDFIYLYEDKELPVLKFQYRDYSEWQNSPGQKKAIKRQEEFWVNQFQDEIPVLNLPTDFTRPAIQSDEGNTLEFDITREQLEKLRAIAAEQGLTTFMILLAIYNIFLSKICSQEDIVVGTPVMGRHHADLENIIGIFINMLPLRNFPGNRKTFNQFLKELKTRTLNAFENQAYQFEDLVEKISINKDTGRNPLFDAVLNVQAVDTTDIKGPDVAALPYEYEISTTKFDLTLAGIEAGDNLSLSFSYRTKLFHKETMEMFIDYFREIVSFVTENENIPLNDIVLTSDLGTVSSDALRDDPGDFGF